MSKILIANQIMDNHGDGVYASFKLEGKNMKQKEAAFSGF